MILSSRSLLLAAGLLAIPAAGAQAQQNNPAGNYGSNNSVTATPGTADNKTMSGMHTGDVGSTTTRTAQTSHTPGGTGRTVVPGSNSTVAGDKAGTAATKTGGGSSTGK